MVSRTGCTVKLQRLARALGQRQREELAVVLDPLAAQCHPHDVVILAGALQRLGESNAVPTLGNLRAGNTKSQPHPAPGEGVQGGCGHRRHRRRTSRDLENRGPDIDLLGLRGNPGQHRRRVRTVCLRCPDHRVAQFVCLPGQHKVLGVVAHPPISEVQSKAHADSVRCRAVGWRMPQWAIQGPSLAIARTGRRSTSDQRSAAPTGEPGGRTGGGNVVAWNNEHWATAGCGSPDWVWAR